MLGTGRYDALDRREQVTTSPGPVELSILGSEVRGEPRVEARDAIPLEPGKILADGVPTILERQVEESYLEEALARIEPLPMHRHAQPGDDLIVDRLGNAINSDRWLLREGIEGEDGAAGLREMPDVRLTPVDRRALLG